MVQTENVRDFETRLSAIAFQIVEAESFSSSKNSKILSEQERTIVDCALSLSAGHFDWAFYNRADFK
jgi:hypothetical protein